MFHIGHLNILKKSSELCEHLIVGVSTDENVLKYKGVSPIIPYKERVAIVKSIKYVDEVVPQVNMDKVGAWKKLHFDVLFHGDDWKGSSMYDELEKQLNKYGCDVVYFKHTKGSSSTMLRKTLHKIMNEK